MPWVTQKNNAITIGPNKEEGQRLTAGGLLVGRRRAGDSWLYSLILQNGEQAEVWGSAGIDSDYKPHFVGKFIKYRFIEMIQTRSGHTFKNIETNCLEPLEGRDEPKDTDPNLLKWPYYQEYQTYTTRAPQEDDPFSRRPDVEEEDDGLPF